MNNKINFYKLYLLNNLKSPVFIITSILFSVYLSLNYFIKNQFFTGNGTTDLILYFSAVPYICILVIPSLCYKPSFTVYDDFIPLKSFTKIFLDFLVHVTLFAIQILLMLPAIFMVNLFGTTDNGQVFTSLVCLLFYGSCLVSLCILIQTVVSSKIVSFIISALVLAFFNTAHLIAVYIQIPEYAAEICKQLSFAWHFDSAGKGLFDTRDIFYFSGSTVLFLILSDIFFQIKRGKVFSKQQNFNNFVYILFSLLIILNSSRWYTRIDFSQNKTYTTSKYTKNLAKTIREPLKITYYRSSNIAKLYPQIRDVSDFLGEYASLSKNISLIIKNPDKDSKTRTLLENYGIQTQQLRTVTNTSTEYLNVYSAIVIEYQGNVETIPFTMSANTLEYDLDGRINHLVTGKARTVNIIIGNGLSLEEDYSYLVPWLNSQGFICNVLYAGEQDFSNKLLQFNGPVLIIGDKTINIDNAIAIENYILTNKGNSLFTVSPYSANLDQDWAITQNKRTNVVEMLENWGVQFLPQIGADISCSTITMTSDDNSQTKVMNYPLWIDLLQQTNTSTGVTLFWPTVLQLSENAKPYLLSSPMGYTFNTDYNSPDKLIETNPFVLETINSGNMEKQSLILGAEITGELKGLYNLGKTDNSHIIVIPDQYFVHSLTNAYIGGDYGDYRNFDFLTETLLKLNGEEELSKLHSKSQRDTSFYKIINFSQLWQKEIFTLICLFAVIPAVIIIFGVVVHVYRKK